MRTWTFCSTWDLRGSEILASHILRLVVIYPQHMPEKVLADAQHHHETQNIRRTTEQIGGKTSAEVSC